MKNSFLKFNISLFISLILILTGSTSVGAQENLDNLVDETKSDLLTVVGGGLAGAVLGLSTLSFVEEPKDHTNNIVVGASIGIITGVIVVALSQANKSRDMIYGEEGYGFINDSKSFGTFSRYEWHNEEFASKVSRFPTPSRLDYHFKF